MARAHCWWSDSMQQAWVLQDEPKRQNSANISSQVREIDIFNEQKMGPDDKVANEMATIIPLTAYSKHHHSSPTRRWSNKL